MSKHSREVLLSGAKLLVHHKNQCLTSDQSLMESCAVNMSLLCKLIVEMNR